MSYSSYKIKLTDYQTKQMANAIKKDMPIKFKLKHSDLSGSSGVPLLLTNRQLGRINKARNAGKGLMLNLSKAQIVAMRKDGGIIPILAALAPFAVAALTSAVGAAAAFGTTKALEAVTGEGRGKIKSRRSRRTRTQKAEGLGPIGTGALFPPGSRGGRLVQPGETGKTGGQIGGERGPVHRSTRRTRMDEINGSALFPTGVRPRRG